MVNEPFTIVQRQRVSLLSTMRTPIHILEQKEGACDDAVSFLSQSLNKLEVLEPSEQETYIKDVKNVAGTLYVGTLLLSQRLLLIADFSVHRRS